MGSTYAEGGSGIAYRVSTRGEGGSKKAEKLRTYYVHVPLLRYSHVLYQHVTTFVWIYLRI